MTIEILGTGKFSFVEFGNLALVDHLVSLILIHWTVIYPVGSFI